MNINRDTIIEDVKNIFVGLHDVKLTGKSTKDVIQQWEKNKSKFLEAWGGTTYELPQAIELDVPETEKDIIFTEYLDVLSFFSAEARKFVESQGHEGFFNNRVVVEYTTRSGKKIQEGAKLSKSLKFFDLLDPTIKEKLQTKLSTFIQMSKLTGKLVFSVDPRDFLSSSENVHNWHSCHALDGEYCAGNLSYMLDDSTFMVYLKAEGEYQLPNFPKGLMWNSKKWRLLLHLDRTNSVLALAKQYPFSSSQLEKITIDEVSRMFDKDYGSTLEGGALNMNKVMKEGLGALNFNDCLVARDKIQGSIHTSDKLVSDIIDGVFPDMEKMTVGETAYCLECGFMLSDTDALSCRHCSGRELCENCLEPIGAREEAYISDTTGELLCSCCAWNCDNCGVTLTLGELIDDMCPDCYEMFNGEEEECW